MVKPSGPQRLISDPLLAGRILFVLIGAYAGWAIGGAKTPPSGLEGTAIGLALSAFLVGCEIASGRIAPRRLTTALLGLTAGLALGNLAAPIIPPQVLGGGDNAPATARLLACLAGGYFGVMLALKNAGLLALFQSVPGQRTALTTSDTIRVLDSSVVIDGRLRGLVEAGLMPGALVVPEFVLLELQRLADSADGQKRARGLRGLSLLSDLRKVTDRIVVMEHDYPELAETDHKLVTLAREIGAELITNDSNLQRVAALQGIRVLNINEMAALLRPTVATGDRIEIALVREGRESGQAVGTLEDGTMVIVDDARSAIGTTVTVEITRVLHTGNGRVVFARLPADTPA